MAEQLHVHLGPMFAGHGASVHLFFTKGPESPIANFMFAFAVLGTLVIVVRRQWVLWPLVAVVVPRMPELNEPLTAVVAFVRRAPAS